MATRDEVIVFGCQDDDLAVLGQALGLRGPAVRVEKSAAKFAEHAVSRRPSAIVLGVGRLSVAHLDLIPVIHAVRAALPVIVIADEDSLEVERSAREKKVFYYLVHPIERPEVEAVLKAALRSSGK